MIFLVFLVLRIISSPFQSRENTIRELIPAFRKCDQKFHSSLNEDSLSLIL